MNPHPIKPAHIYICSENWTVRTHSHTDFLPISPSVFCFRGNSGSAPSGYMTNVKSKLRRINTVLPQRQQFRHNIFPPLFFFSISLSHSPFALFQSFQPSLPLDVQIGSREACSGGLLLLSGKEVEMPKTEVQARQATERKPANFRHRARATRGSRWIWTNMEDQRTSLHRRNSPPPLKCPQRLSARPRVRRSW